jgi:hypothetical protein
MPEDMLVVVVHKAMAVLLEVAAEQEVQEQIQIQVVINRDQEVQE